MSISLSNQDNPILTSQPALAVNSSSNIHHELIAGTFAGWAQVFVGHPFDTVKVKLQTQPNPPVYAGAMDCARQIVQKDKLVGLYRGATSPLLGVGACNAMIFASNGVFKSAIAKFNNRSSPENLNLAEMTLAGGLTGATVSFINCPVEFLKIQLQVQKDAVGAAVVSKSSLFDVAKAVHNSQGFLGLYRGYFITFLRDVPSFAGYFGNHDATYNGLKSLYFANVAPGEVSPKLPETYQLLFGGLAGISGWVVCYPQDVLKSRIQGSPSNVAPLSLTQVWRELRQDGRAKPGLMNQLRPFLRGVAPTLARAFPANAATFLVYEAYMNHFAKP